MSDKISVILELTEHEALVLYSLTLRGGNWEASGKFGKAVKEIYDALDDILQFVAKRRRI